LNIFLKCLFEFWPGHRPFCLTFLFVFFFSVYPGKFQDIIRLEQSRISPNVFQFVTLLPSQRHCTYRIKPYSDQRHWNVVFIRDTCWWI